MFEKLLLVCFALGYITFWKRVTVNKCPHSDCGSEAVVAIPRTHEHEPPIGHLSPLLQNEVKIKNLNAEKFKCLECRRTFFNNKIDLEWY